MEVILNQENLKQALKRVKADKGAPGVDGISVSELPDHLKRQWPELRSNLLAGRYKPQPVRRVDIPKPGGGTRQLGIPTVMDRFIQQAVMQVLQSQWDPTFSESNYGFRVGRSAHQAVKRAKRYVEEGQQWVVDIDLEKFFDRVNHDVLMSRVAKRITDKRALKLMRAFLNAGIMQAGLVSPQMEGTPQGGLLSPLLSNVLLDELDRELEKRGLKHVRYADDSNIYVRSKRAGKRVKESITHWLEKRLKLKVNERKSAVSPPGERKFLGYSISPGKGRAWILIAPESIRRAKSRRREITGRSKGLSLEQVIGKLRVYLTGWRNYYSLNELPSLTRNLLGWIRRRLRSLLWKQWKKERTRYSELRVRGVGKDLAAQTVGSSHKQWRISLSPALCIALLNRLFREMGFPDI
ncbi:group II intron reverse transcriptase/maturase [Serratia symbiotica]|uniref:group II intron reverse transcriptase/maturase n=1 Tax=Serratia symbiotica TaxID=138074 RepID=UPI0020905A80|nr:group II intron reverse transcriptase/maturase [Serratia symbiotica]USS95679.1 group II intron reverse transcriptase/maturase [Serratia symbiotica]